jgi:uncharacterized protein YhaN
MFLVELVMQGVRGFQRLVRLRFQGGFNIVTAGNEGGKTTAVDSIVRLLFPVNDAGRMENLTSRSAADGSRAALVLFGDDQAYFRVIQDFTRRAVNLSRYNAATKDFALVQKDWASTAGFLATLLPGMSEEDYARLFVLRRDAGAGPAAQAAPAEPMHRPAAVPQARPAPPRAAAQETRLTELRETLRKAEEAADAEYKADAARIRLGEIAKKLERFDESGRQVAELEAQLAELKACENLPADLSDLISAHEQEQSRKTVKIDEVDRDIEGLTIQRDTIPQANLLTDKLFIAGVVVGALALVAGLFLLSEEQAVFFPLGILGSLLLIAAGWYNGTRRNAQRKDVQREIDALVKERADIERKFQESGAAIMKCMQATGSSSAAALKEQADNYRHLQEMHRDMAEQQGLALGGQQREEVQAELAGQQAETASLEKAAKDLARYAVDTYSVRQEIDRIESEMSPATPAAEADLSFASGFGGDFTPPGHQAASGTNILADIAVASRVSGIEMDTLVPAVESAAQRNLAAASGGAYIKVEAGPDGLPVIHDRGGVRLPFAALSHSTRELVCFCLRTGIVEAIAGKRRLPCILDDPFAGMDPGRQQAACQVLRVLGAKTQVILFTSNPALKTPNDAAAELK